MVTTFFLFGIADLMTVEGSNLAWPGITIPVIGADGQTGSRAAAVLRTSNGVGIGYLLATHKAQLDQMTNQTV